MNGHSMTQIMMVTLDTCFASIVAIMSGGNVIVATGSFISTVGTIAGTTIFATVTGVVMVAVIEDFDQINDLVVNVMPEDHHTLFGIDILLPTKPKLIGVSTL